MTNLAKPCNHTTSIPAHLEIGRPRGIPLVDSFLVMFCADPTCGPHIVCLDKLGLPFCELLMTAEQVNDLGQLTLTNLTRSPRQ